jgi:hypothetical protein
MRNKDRQKENSRCTRLKASVFGGKNLLRIMMVAIIISLVAISIGPAMGQAIQASSSGKWTAVSGGSGVTGVNTNEVKWGSGQYGQSGLRFDGQSVSSAFGQEFCLGMLTHFNWPISNAANGATLKVTLDFSTPALPDAPFTYQMGIDETTNYDSCGQCVMGYSPCDPSNPCPDKISWPATPPADQTFDLNGDTYTLQILGIRDSCSSGSSLPYFITQEYKNNVGYLVGRIVLTSRPDAIDDFYNTKTNVPLTVPAPGVLGNDFEKSGLDLDVVSYTQPAHGTVTVDLESGATTYTPNTNFCGTDTFTYKITNGQGKFDEATVTITVVCDDNNACTIDACVNGVCTHTAVVCTDNNPCTDDSCNPATGACVYTNDNTNICADSDACNGVETCLGGVCQNPADLVCTDSNPCTDDSCNPASGCVYTNDNTNICADSNACNGVETCLGGVCQNPADLVCTDSNPCTDDSCNPASGCVYTNDNTNICADSDACNGVETCLSGVCQNPADLVCTDSNPCTDDSCNPATGCVNAANTASCDDGNACTTGDICANKACTSGASVSCDDGLWCNGAETCDATEGCQAGTAPVVDDGVVCTDDSCDETNDVIVNTPNNGKCDNGLWCDGAETCDATKDCQAGTAPVVDDGVACTDDLCDETTDKVVHTPVDSRCSDNDVCNGVETCDPSTGCTNPDDLVCNNGQFCDGEETCDAIAGCQDGADPLVDDGIACTDDSCDETTDKVVHTPVDSRCSDNDVCNGVETCDPDTGCQDGTPVNCDDGIACTADSCAAGECGHTPILVAEDDEYEASEDETLTVTVDIGVLVNEEYGGTGTLTVASFDATSAKGGTVAMNGDGSFSYTPLPNFCSEEGRDSFTYVATDGACSDGATVYIDVICLEEPNQCPAPVDDNYQIKQDTTLTVPNDEYLGVLDNDVDAEEDDLSATLVSGPANGQVILNPDGSFTYTPKPGFCGTDSFIYAASDAVCSGQATANIVVVCNVCPVAEDDEYAVAMSKVLTVGIGDSILLNDEDPEGDMLTAVLVTGPSHGKLTLNADGTFTYTPTKGWTGTDSFTYKANDGKCSSVPATVHILVAKCPWYLNGEIYSASCGVALSIPKEQGILANDLTAVAVKNPRMDAKYGVIDVEEDGSFVYTPLPGIKSGTYAYLYYGATNGVCDATGQALAKIMVVCCK